MLKILKTLNLPRISRQSVRFILWGGFCLFFLLVCVPLVFFYYLFNPDEVKHMVISQFNNKNFAVQIGGNIEPRSWHGLSLFISDIVIMDKAQHKVVHVNTANCQLSWWELVIGHYKVKRMALNGLTFYQGATEQIHYADLFNYENIAKSEFNNLTHLSVTNLSWIESTGKFIIRDASAAVAELNGMPHATLHFELSKYHAQVYMSGQVSQIKEGNLIISGLDTHIDTPDERFDLQSSARYNYLNQELWIDDTRGVVAGKLYNGSLNIKTMLVSIYGYTANDMVANLNYTDPTLSHSLNLTAKKLLMVDFNSYTIGELRANYSAITAQRRLDLKMNFRESKIDPLLNISNHGCSVQVNYSLIGTPEASLGANLSGECGYMESRHLLKLKVAGKVDDAPAKIDMQYAMRVGKNLLIVNGDLTNLDVSKFMTGAKGKILPLYTDNSPLPLSWLKWLDIEGNLLINQLTLSHFNLNKVKTRLLVKDNRLTVSDLQANVYDGRITGSTTISMLGESYGVALNFMVQGVNLQKMFASLFEVNAIRGRANVSINSTTTGVVSYRDLHSKMNGEIELSMVNGGFSGVDFNLFLSPENLAAFQNRNSMMTNFTTLRARFIFRDGISKSGNLSFASPNIRASGDGVINFVDTSLDYRLQVSSILPRNVQNIKSVSIPVMINGDLFNPKIYIQNMTLNSDSPKLGKNRKAKK